MPSGRPFPWKAPRKRTHPLARGRGQGGGPKDRAGQSPAGPPSELVLAQESGAEGILASSILSPSEAKGPRKPRKCPAPKLVFNRVNGKRPPLMTPPTLATEENYTVAHEENVRFVYEAWQQVQQQLDGVQQGDSRSGPVQYTEKTPGPELKDFVPIDLEDWWAQQFLAKIENGS
ncbi:MAPK regulated corepressor interacting protein 2 isoform X1 [Podarcis raffonei]|uniref:MAPK regulated corepressor interacting protein 2 isoform X1 n=1 Tax=Podarcis raffonei TaxID=65483 RepID=UPI0023291BD6|nr:MAPK regulated corepressor interacting protein 2 isoform X1 [Podarcis raffonei]